MQLLRHLPAGQFVAVLAATTLLGSCALLDGLGGSEDAGPPEGDAPSGVGNCGTAIDLGDLSAGAVVGPFDSCTFDFDIDFGQACPMDIGGHLGMVFKFTVTAPREYSICTNTQNAAMFTVRDGPCTEAASGACIETDNMGFACTSLFLNVGEILLYWEPITDGCASVGFDLTPSDIGMPSN